MADEQAPVVAVPVESKKPWLSKTLILNLVVAVSAMAVPPVAAWIQGHGDAVVSIFAAINFLLRLVSSDKISLKD